jgi:hypothetical protein
LKEKSTDSALQKNKEVAPRKTLRGDAPLQSGIRDLAV